MNTKRIDLNEQGITVVDIDDFVITGNTFIPNDKLYELADRIKKEKQHEPIKMKLGEGDISGIVLLEIGDSPTIKRFQVFCSWFANWNIQHIGCSLDIAFQNNVINQEKILSVTIRKKYKHYIKSLTKILKNEELDNCTSTINIRNIAEDAILKLDNNYKNEMFIGTKK